MSERVPSACFVVCNCEGESERTEQEYGTLAYNNMH